MKIQPDCIPCIMTMAVNSMNKLSLPPSEARALCTDILALPGLRGLDWGQTSPDIIEKIMEKLSSHTQLPDPFREEKKRLNQQVLGMRPFMEDLVHQSSDPILAAARLSILGNSIDFMMPGGTASVEAYIRQKAQMPVPENAYAQFLARLKTARRVVYFTDNCGEIVFDALLIRTLKSRFDTNVTVVVRNRPTLNDATVKEAREAGLDRVARVVENGIDGPLPGTVLDRCSKAVKDTVDQSDLIIAKGGGNFDSLSEEVDTLKTDVTFMLLSKCRPISRYFNAAMHSLILANFFH